MTRTLDQEVYLVVMIGSGTIVDHKLIANKGEAVEKCLDFVTESHGGDIEIDCDDDVIAITNGQHLDAWAFQIPTTIVDEQRPAVMAPNIDEAERIATQRGIDAACTQERDEEPARISFTLSISGFFDSPLGDNGEWDNYMADKAAWVRRRLDEGCDTEMDFLEEV